MWTYNYNTNELYHHGVKGMKWGVRRAQRKAAREARKAALTPEQRKKSKIKKTVGIGAAVVGITLAAFGGYKLHKAIDNNAWDKAVDIGRKRVAEKEALFGKVVMKDSSGFEFETTAFRVRSEADKVYDNMRYSDKVKYFADHVRNR